MRALLKWSDNSFSVTTPRPRQGVPSRRMAVLLCALEITGIDVLETGVLEAESDQLAARLNHCRRGVGTHVAVAQQTKDAVSAARDTADARNCRKALLDICAAVTLNLDGEAAAQHLPAKLGDRADQRDAAI